MDRCLVDFDMLFDIDFGICKLFLDKYNNPEFIKDIHIISDDFLLSLLVDRSSIEPLTILLKSDYIDKAQSLRTQALAMHEEEIYNNSHICKPISDMLTVADKVNTVHFAVYCKNIYEEQLVRKHFKSAEIVNRRDFNNYDAFIIKYYKDVQDNVDNLLRKSVYLPLCGYNVHREYNTVFYINQEFEDTILNRVSVTMIAMHFIKEDDMIYG